MLVFSSAMSVLKVRIVRIDLAKASVLTHIMRVHAIHTRVSTT